MDRFVVRITAILVNVYIPIVLLFALHGIDISVFDYIFSSTFLLGVVLTTLSHSQGKYHCVWMRALCYNALLTPMVNFVDSTLFVFEDSMTYIYVVASMWSATILATIVLAVDHFVKVRKLKKKRYEIL